MITQALVGLANYLTDQGFDQPTTAAIVANAHHESGGDPKAMGDNGTSFGLFQWHNERGAALMDFARKQGLSPKDPIAQYEFLVHELQTDYPKLVQRMAETGSPARAAHLFQAGFERPKVIDPERSRTAEGVDGWLSRQAQNRPNRHMWPDKPPLPEGTIISPTPPPAPSIEKRPEGEMPRIRPEDLREAPDGETSAYARLSDQDLAKSGAFSKAFGFTPTAPGGMLGNGPSSPDDRLQHGLTIQALIVRPELSLDDVMKDPIAALMGVHRQPKPIGQALTIPPTIDRVLNDPNIQGDIRKSGFTGALETSDFAKEIGTFLKDAGGLSMRAMRRAGFQPEPPSATIKGRSRAELKSLDKETQRQFSAGTAKLIASTPGWYALPRAEQRKALEGVYASAMQAAQHPLVRQRVAGSGRLLPPGE